MKKKGVQNDKVWKTMDKLSVGEECRHEPCYLTIVGYCTAEGVVLIQCDKCESMRTAPFTKTYDYGSWKELRSF